MSDEEVVREAQRGDLLEEMSTDLIPTPDHDRERLKPGAKPPKPRGAAKVRQVLGPNRKVRVTP